MEILDSGIVHGLQKTKSIDVQWKELVMSVQSHVTLAFVKIILVHSLLRRFSGLVIGCKANWYDVSRRQQRTEIVLEYVDDVRQTHRRQLQVYPHL